MLTLDREQTTALDYSVVNTSIQETFTAIDRFECFAVDEILLMREQQLYLQAGYKSFEEYCQRELYAWGGYRRINQLLGAKKVIDAVGELGGHIKNERQARPLLRLVKEPEKLKQAVAIALKDNPSPSVSDFAAAANIVVPQLPRKKQSIQEPMVPKIQEPVVPQKAIVTVSQQSHPRYGEEGTIEADAPNRWQQIVTFADGERLLINNTDLDASSVPFPRERNYPAEYTEAIAQIKEQHKLELERLEQELRIGLQAEAGARAEAQVQEQIQSLQNLYKQQREQNIQLQERLDEMEGLKKLEIENQQLLSRIQELERAVQQHPVQQWGNTMTQQATKALNKQVKQALEKTIDLRSLAQEPPKENAQECLRLMGMALKNLASAMNNTQALEAAAIILGSEPTPSAIAYRAEQLEMLPQAISEIRAVLAKPGCTWQEFWAVAQEYEVIKQDYWGELTTQETDLITALQKSSTEPRTICPSCGQTICFTTIESPAKPNFSRIRLRQGFSLALTEIDLSVSTYRLDLVTDTLRRQGLRGASPTKMYSAIFIAFIENITRFTLGDWREIVKMVEPSQSAITKKAWELYKEAFERHKNRILAMSFVVGFQVHLTEVTSSTIHADYSEDFGFDFE